MRSQAPAEFWLHFDRLPADIQRLAKKNFSLFAEDSSPPSLRFKPFHGSLWSARIGEPYRAVARKDAECWTWFWIGTHEAYNKLGKQLR